MGKSLASKHLSELPHRVPCADLRGAYIITLGSAVIQLLPASCRSCPRRSFEASLPLSLIDYSAAVFDPVVWSFSTELTCNDNEINAVGIIGRRTRWRGERPDSCCDAGSECTPEHSLSC